MARGRDRGRVQAVHEVDPGLELPRQAEALGAGEGHVAVGGDDSAGGEQPGQFAGDEGGEPRVPPKLAEPMSACTSATRLLKRAAAAGRVS